MVEKTKFIGKKLKIDYGAFEMFATGSKHPKGRVSPWGGGVVFFLESTF